MKRVFTRVCAALGINRRPYVEFLDRNPRTRTQLSVGIRYGRRVIDAEIDAYGISSTAQQLGVQPLSKDWHGYRRLILFDYETLKMYDGSEMIARYTSTRPGSVWGGNFVAATP